MTVDLTTTDRPATVYVAAPPARRSYLAPALISLGLYFCFFVPGAVVNLIYLFSAEGEKRRSGETPEGYGLLVGLAVVFLLVPLVAVVTFLGASVVAGIVAMIVGAAGA